MYAGYMVTIHVIIHNRIMKKKISQIYTRYMIHIISRGLADEGHRSRKPIRIGKYNIIIPLTWIYSCSALEDLDFLIS